jgi:hypothetical protein
MPRQKKDENDRRQTAHQPPLIAFGIKLPIPKTQSTAEKIRPARGFFFQSASEDKIKSPKTPPAISETMLAVCPARGKKYAEAPRTIERVPKKAREALINPVIRQRLPKKPH